MATYQIPAPPPMSCGGNNVEENWKAFQESYEDYSIATELTEKDNTVQVATLKTLMGPECRKHLKGLTLTVEELKNPDTILDKLKEHFSPTRNVLYDRYLFFAASQHPNESIDKYLIRLRQLASPCKFQNMEEEMIRDRLVLGCADANARARLFRRKETEVDLKHSIDALQISEATSRQLKVLNGEQQVNYVKNKGKPFKKKSETKKNPEYHSQKPGQRVNEYNKSNCGYCGTSHAKRKEACPAYGKTCRKCGWRNHLAQVCRRKQQVHQTEEASTDSEDDGDEFYFNESDESALKIETIGTVEDGTRKIMTNLLVETSTGKRDYLKCQIDTGATCNVMSHRDVKKLTKEEKPKMFPTDVKLKTYNGHIIPVKGRVHLKCTVNNVEHKIMFNVVETKQAPLLSSQTSIKMGLIKVCENVYWKT